MADRVIDDVNIDSPRNAPPRHYALDKEGKGITDLLMHHSREKSCFVPVLSSCKRKTEQRRCDRCGVVGRWGPDRRITQVRRA